MGIIHKDKIGLVFSGGGGKGAYEAGAWQALREKKLDRFITGVSGTSIGGLTAVLFATDDFTAALELWQKAKIAPKEAPNIFSKNWAKKVADKIAPDASGTDLYSGLDNWLRSHFLSSRKLHELIIDRVDSKALMNSQRTCFVTCHDYKKKEAVYYNVSQMEDSEEVYKVIRATASIPYIFRPVKVGDRLLCDGGLSDNTPIKPLVEAGFNKIIVIKLKQEQDDYATQFPGVKIAVLYPQKSLGNFLAGSLNFYAETIDEKWAQGYLEMLQFIKKNKKIFKP